MFCPRTQHRASGESRTRDPKIGISCCDIAGRMKHYETCANCIGFIFCTFNADFFFIISQLENCCSVLVMIWQLQICSGASLINSLTNTML